MKTILAKIKTFYTVDEREQSSGRFCIDLEGQVIRGSKKNISFSKLNLIATIEILKNLFAKEDTHLIVQSSDYITVQGINKWLSTWEKNEWRNSRNKPVKNNDLWKEFSRLSSHYKVSAIWTKKTDPRSNLDECKPIIIRLKGGRKIVK